MKNFIAILCALCLITMISCQQEDITAEKSVVYNDSVYDIKQYKVERHPALVRNGFGMDIYHDGNVLLDTMYLKTANSSFNYDLLFYSEMAYFPLSTGDYSSSGYPVIFLYTDTLNDANSVKAAMIGQGLNCFNSFSIDSVSSTHIAKLQSDPYIDLADYRTEVHTATIDGVILLQSTAETLFSNLSIGIKFRPNIGGVFNLDDVSDEAQIDLQPVFLIKTREGLYAKFMVTRFKGLGVDTQKLTLQWQALKSTQP